VNEAAKLIKSLDKTRPVAICNGDVLYLDHFAKLCPDVDVFGLNSYRGGDGFGISIWRSIHEVIDRPAVITEYGCPAFHERLPIKEAEIEQMEYHKGNWDDIEYHSYKGAGEGTALGGVCFQWIDGWWKSGQPPRYSPVVQENLGQWPGPFPGGWGYEEYLGIVGQGDGTHSPFLRVLRPAYFYYKEAWNKD
jgi:beta-glucuronidase